MTSPKNHNPAHGAEKTTPMVKASSQDVPPYPQGTSTEKLEEEAVFYRHLQLVEQASNLSLRSHVTSSSLRGDPRSVGSESVGGASVRHEDIAVWHTFQNRRRQSGELPFSYANEPEYRSRKSLTNGSLVEGYSPELPYPSQAYLDSASFKTSRVRFPSQPVRPDSATTGGSTRHAADATSAYHEGVLQGRLERPEVTAWRQKWNKRTLAQRRVITASVVAALTVLFGMVLLLGFTQSKKMARGTLTGSITLIWACLGAGMHAGDRSIVEILIALNMVLVWGIFLTAQVDALIV